MQRTILQLVSTNLTREDYLRLEKLRSDLERVLFIKLSKYAFVRLAVLNRMEFWEEAVQQELEFRKEKQ